MDLALIISVDVAIIGRTFPEMSIMKNRQRIKLEIDGWIAACLCISEDAFDQINNDITIYYF